LKGSFLSSFAYKNEVFESSAYKCTFSTLTSLQLNFKSFDFMYNFIMVKVSAAIVTHQKRILLFLRDNNSQIRDPNRWSLIGGHSEGDETSDDALIREVQEEISITPSRIKFQFKFIGNHNEDLSIYHINLASVEACNIKLGNEGQKVEFFTFEQLENLPLTENLELIYDSKKELIKNLIDDSI
jgi:ADP-ribose pyrophosphatase YjhB (NUDIX family)